LGGAVETDRLHEFHWELHLSELKFRRRSNVVPIGSVCKGIYCHRAMLFKVQAYVCPGSLAYLQEHGLHFPFFSFIRALPTDAWSKG
jgi:hypothetical protein